MTNTGPHATEPTPHPRLTVAFVPGDVPHDLPSRLRSGSALVVDASALSQRADAVSDRHRPARQAALAALEAAHAKAEHDVTLARERLKRATVAQEEAAQGAVWAAKAAQRLPSLRTAVADAKGRLDVAEGEQRQARAVLERVLEQSAAAGAAMEEANRELGELTVAGMDETGLRRELEASGTAVRQAQEAYEASARRLMELQAELDTATERRTAFQTALAAHGAADVVDRFAVAEVQGALDEWRRAAAQAEPDKYAQDLADAWTDLQADLGELDKGSVPLPDADTLAAVEERVAFATAALEAARSAQPQAVMDDDTRAALDAAHETILSAEERSGRRVGGGSARRQLEEARATEREILDRFGFGSYIDVVLTGGRRPTADDTAVVRAQQDLRAALDARATLRQDLETASPERAYLNGEAKRLMGEVVKVLGFDPGPSVAEALRAYRPADPAVVEGLRRALEAAGIETAGEPIDRVAAAWLAEQDSMVTDHDRWGDAVEQARAELQGLNARLAELEVALPGAREAEAHAAEQLEMARRSVGAFEAELSVRAAEDAKRLKRLAAAEQLRVQVESVSATLATAERSARASLDQAAAAVAEAERTLTQGQAEMSAIEDRSRALCRLLPVNQMPAGDLAAVLESLAARLDELGQSLAGPVREADLALGQAKTAMGQAADVVDAAREGAQGRNGDDWVEALAQSMAEPGRPVMVLDRAFDAVAPALHERLLATLAEGPVSAPVVLLTADAAMAGWAIELPQSAGTVTNLDRVLNSNLFSADNSSATDDTNSGSARTAGRR